MRHSTRDIYAIPSSVSASPVLISSVQSVYCIFIRLWTILILQG
jgi:hypothetical protein